MELCESCEDPGLCQAEDCCAEYLIEQIGETEWSERVEQFPILVDPGDIDVSV